MWKNAAVIRSPGESALRHNDEADIEYILDSRQVMWTPAVGIIRGSLYREL